MNTNPQAVTKEFWVEPPELGNKNSKRCLWVERADIYCFTKDESDFDTELDPEDVKPSSAPYLLVGFDTEFKTPSEALTPAEVKEAGRARSLILSYQFHAKTSTGVEWSGICCPEADERISLRDFMLFVFGTGARTHNIRNLPTTVYLVGHFTRADIPAFSDFKELTKYMSAVRSTFVTTNDRFQTVGVSSIEGDDIELKVFLRDTMLLTPQSSKSLKALGELVGVKKVELAPDKETYRQIIKNMDRLRSADWDLFKRYALTDAEICVRYIEKVIDQYKSVTGKFKVPITLTSIGVDLLLKSWADQGIDHLSVLGQEIVYNSYYSKSKGRYIRKKKAVEIDVVHRETVFVTECYHGGRNEQFWFGPCFTDDWSDFDLSSAYPTAMSLIGKPDWHAIHDSKNLDDFGPETLGFVQVEFEFPSNTRYPCLPVRTENGLIFPLKGVSYCAAPELFIARKLGASLRIMHGVIVPVDQSVRIFGDFIKDCINNRLDAGSKTLEGLFWKEISNSTYGKTAQGLQEKRVYDMRDKETHILPPSPITSAYFAAYITSFTRAVLGEILNSIPEDKMVFSCTTDGFLSNLSDAEAAAVQQGELVRLYSSQRKILTGDPTVLEKKHAVKRPLGWRTRGQATLVAGEDLSDSLADGSVFHIVLAKGGIFTAPEFEDDVAQNAEIVRMFFSRTPESRIEVVAKTGVRDMVEHDADLVEKIFSKRLSMEFDWKRCPHAAVESSTYSHLAFSTRPWLTKEQFFSMRGFWSEYESNDPQCLRTRENLDDFSAYAEARSFMTTAKAKYFRKTNGAVSRLRLQLCRAYKNTAAGLKPKMNRLTDQKFADLLVSVGIPCTKADVENGKKRVFDPHSCPPTDQIKALLNTLREHLTSLDVDLFLYDAADINPIYINPSTVCPFIQRVD